MAEAKPDKKPAAQRPTYAVEAIPSDVNNGVFLGNPALDNVVSCVIAMQSGDVGDAPPHEGDGGGAGAERRLARQDRGLRAERRRKGGLEEDRDRFISMTLGPLGNQGYRSFGEDFPKG